MRVLGTDPASQPPIELRLSTELAPIASSIVVTTRLAPFALKPDFAVSLAIDGLRGAGLTRVAPDLAAKLDGTGLVDGHATATATLALRTGRRDPLDFSALSNAFGLDLTVGKVDVHDGPKGPVLVGLDELHADVAGSTPCPTSTCARSRSRGPPGSSARRRAVFASSTFS